MSKINIKEPSVVIREKRLGTINAFTGTASQIVEKSAKGELRDCKRKFSQCLGCNQQQAFCPRRLSVVGGETIKKQIRVDCLRYDVKIACAHNAMFDNRALNTTQRYITTSKYRYFLPYGVEWWDTLKMSRAILKNDESFGEFCYNNDYLTARGCRRYTAEIIYRFLTGCNDFVESHTGLEDVKIEREIFKFCIEREPEIDGRLWGDR